MFVGLFEFLVVNAAAGKWNKPSGNRLFLVLWISSEKSILLKVGKPLTTTPFGGAS
jgi:hypothetical protein